MIQSNLACLEVFAAVYPFEHRAELQAWQFLGQNISHRAACQRMPCKTCRCIQAGSDLLHACFLHSKPAVASCILPDGVHHQEVRTRNRKVHMPHTPLLARLRT